MIYKCIIIDDEPPAHSVLKEHIKNTPGLIYEASFYNAKDALAFLHSNQTDIIFIDIKMPEISGVQFLKSLSEKPVVVFTTAYRNYALEGFELGVMDYLLKPISYTRFSVAASRLIDFLNLKNKGDELIVSNPGNESNTITIKSGTKLIKLPLHSISHIQGLKDYAIFYTGIKKYVVKGYIKLIYDTLPRGSFTRVHKSFIVANSRIKLLNKGRIEFDNYQVPVGRSYKIAVKKIFNSL